MTTFRVMGRTGPIGRGLSREDADALAAVSGCRVIPDPVQRYTCPAPLLPGLLVGCGSVFDAEVDDEGLVDCPECGLWFNPEEESSRAEERAEAEAEATS